MSENGTIRMEIRLKALEWAATRVAEMKAKIKAKRGRNAGGPTWAQVEHNLHEAFLEGMKEMGRLVDEQE